MKTTTRLHISFCLAVLVIGVTIAWLPNHASASSQAAAPSAERSSSHHELPADWPQRGARLMVQALAGVGGATALAGATYFVARRRARR
jgi:hypothetical protein